MSKTRFSLVGKTAVITGGGGFFGRYFTRALLEHGASVVIIERSPQDMKFFSEKFEDRYLTKFVDLYDRQAAEAGYREILENGPVDILINNAFDFSKRTGFNTPDGRLENSSFEQLEASFESGIYWAVQSTKIIGLAMKSIGHGSIINICSMYAVVVPSPDLYDDTEKFNPPGYSMAKAGLLQFTKYAASFLSPEVRVNAISPGAIPNLETKTDNSITQNDPVLERLSKKILLKRMGHPNDLTGALVFLASDASGYITGQNIIIDGGLTVT